MADFFWKDSFEALGRALERLVELVEHEDRDKVDYIIDATIQRFEFVIELYWKVLKKILAYEKVDATSPRDVIKNAYRFELIDDEKAWLAMLDDRNQTSHVYREEDALEIFCHIQKYTPVLQKSYQKLKERYF